jgi:hypothetical protein
MQKEKTRRCGDEKSKDGMGRIGDARDNVKDDDKQKYMETIKR